MIDLIVHLIASVVDEISDKKRGQQRPPPRRPSSGPTDGGTTGGRRVATAGGTRLHPDLAHYGLDIDTGPVSQQPPVTTPVVSKSRPAAPEPRPPTARQPRRRPTRVQSTRHWLHQGANLRRAIVAKEILDPPTALREERSSGL